LRRWLELRATLIVAALAAGGILVSRRRGSWAGLACIPVAAAAGLGVATTIGVDGLISVNGADHLDQKSRRFGELTPQRFAVVGWGGELDPMLSLKASRDIEYLDFGESGREGYMSDMREAADVWARDGRPVFGTFHVGFKWQFADDDLPAREIDPEHGFWSIGPPRRPAPPRDSR
jgi:hypothetical protein